MMIALLIASAVTVEGDTTCPSAAQVSASLAPLLTRGNAAEPHQARLHERADGVDVELRSGGGRPLAERTFARSSSCDELASAIAVAIATSAASFAGAT